eukprot:m.72758 g.72758  ORF g.72758 m.72758 type:complete len:193 (-) comp50249_c0_seq2:54-632(-)
MAKFSTYTNLPVQWGEVDANGRVNDFFYMRYLEAGRVAALNTIYDTIGREGGQVMMNESGVGGILASASLKFRAPLSHPDEILIGIKHKELGHDFFTQTYGIFSLSQGKLVAEAESRVSRLSFLAVLCQERLTLVCLFLLHGHKVVLFDYKHNKKAAIPLPFRKAVEDLEAQTGNRLESHDTPHRSVSPRAW